MLRLNNLAKAFSARTLFENVSLDFPEGEKIALVGANGSGKTTLLNIITGIDLQDSGEVLLGGKSEIGYLPQQPNPNPKESVLLECASGAKWLFAQKQRLDELVQLLASGQHDEALIHEHEELQNSFHLQGGYAVEARASEILAGLGFKREQMQAHPFHLSGGWRMRLELAKIFLLGPDVLILDEPTNHLDLPSLAWTERFLSDFKGTLIFVSHDRILLNRLSTRTVYLGGGKIAMYVGNFDAFLSAREKEMEQNLAILDKLSDKRKQYEKFVERFGAKATKAAQARSRVKMIEKLKLLEQKIEIQDSDAEVAFKFPIAPPSGRMVVEMNGLAIGYDQKALVSQLNLKIERASRIAIIGANGIGKSTLIKTLAQRIPVVSGGFSLGHNVKPAYFAQDPMELFTPQDDLLTHMLNSDPTLGQREARSLLGGFLFRSEDVFKKPTVLSGGEKNRLAMAILLARRANFLLLDEPTNHLDMQSVELLIDALIDYEGTIIFVSHNRDFIDALCTHVLVMLADGQFALFHGQLADYERSAEQRGFPNVLAVAPKEPNTAADSAKKERSLSENRMSDYQLAKQQKSERARLKKKLDELEKTQISRQNEISTFATQLATLTPSEFVKMGELQLKISQCEQALSEAEHEWLMFAEQLETLRE